MSDESDGGSRELSPKKSPLEDAGNKVNIKYIFLPSIRNLQIEFTIDLCL